MFVNEQSYIQPVMCIKAPLSYIPMFYIKCRTLCKVYMHAGTISKLVYGCGYVREIIHSLKLVDYLPVHTHKPHNNLHLYSMYNCYYKEVLIFVTLLLQITLHVVCSLDRKIWVYYCCNITEVKFFFGPRKMFRCSLKASLESPETLSVPPNQMYSWKNQVLLCI